MPNPRTPEGEELTPEVLEELAAEAEAGYEKVNGEVTYLGRPALSRSGPSKQLRVRIEPELDRSISTIAERQGRSVSELARDALREYVAHHD